VRKFAQTICKERGNIKIHNEIILLARYRSRNQYKNKRFQMTIITKYVF